MKKTRFSETKIVSIFLFCVFIMAGNVQSQSIFPCQTDTIKVVLARETSGSLVFDGYDAPYRQLCLVEYHKNLRKSYRKKCFVVRRDNYWNFFHIQMDTCSFVMQNFRFLESKLNQDPSWTKSLKVVNKTFPTGGVFDWELMQAKLVVAHIGKQEVITTNFKRKLRRGNHSFKTQPNVFMIVEFLDIKPVE